MGNNQNIRDLKIDIRRYKINLIKKAKAKGLYENFGQTEVRKLKDKYDIWDSEISNLIGKFNNWVMNVNDRDLK